MNKKYVYVIINDELDEGRTPIVGVVPYHSDTNLVSKRIMHCIERHFNVENAVVSSHEIIPLPESSGKFRSMDVACVFYGHDDTVSVTIQLEVLEELE